MSEVIAERKPLPTGTVTFLFSDIEGSTERWERHRAEMKAAVAQHEQLMQAAIAAHDGYVFKTMGDAFCVAFRTVPDAISAALDAQRALQEQDFARVDGLKVRMAIHTGLADERSGDYFGPTVNRVARLLSIGHGGQVLVSGAASDLAQGEMPGKATLRDLGAHRLKDLAYPEQVYQLLEPGLPQEFPALRSLESLPNNLPLQVTAFLGREQDIADIKERLAKTRLLTLVGTGGVGKTRLSLQVGADLLDHYEDGVWFVELAPLIAPDLIPGAMATVFGVAESTGKSQTESLVVALKPKRMLVILDNCEHIVAGAARIADVILRGCPRVYMIATSRQGLGIDGEAVLRVASLPVPPAAEGIKAVEAQRYGAVALFVERASAVVENFRLTDDNAPAIAQICRRLDGIALAIELAASRIKMLTPAQLLTMLSERFRVLTGGKRTALPRQQTMRAAIDWSYDLLDDNEKLMFRRLAVFSGGSSLEAVREICGDETIGEWEVFELLSSLVDKSLVTSEASGAEQRYRLLESTRQYALEKLNQAGELERLQRRHAAFFAQRAFAADDSWKTTATLAWLAPIEADYDNYRSVMDWALLEGQDPELGAAVTGALSQAWRGGLYQAEGRLRLEAAVAKIDEAISRTTQARLWLGLAMIYGSYAEWTRTQHSAQIALRIYQELANEQGVAMSRQFLGEALLRMRKFDDAEECLDLALATFKKLNEKRLIAMTLSSFGRSRFFADKPEEARKFYDDALTIARAIGDERQASVISSNLAEIEFLSGNHERAVAIAREDLQHLKGYPNKTSIAITCNNLSAYLNALGRHAEAYDSAAEAIRYGRDAQNKIQIALSIQHLAAVAVSRHDLPRAARLLGYVEAQLNAHEWMLEFTEQQELDKVRKRLSKDLSLAETTALLEKGALLSEDQALEEALQN
ncbi:MAG TPA: adenylate/guanylate cyclase domain-containing protein [Candidatus Eremiobacteraceae bacterium]|nr:adenylate/guanylate cyclase domain-containing protein [Candidatus Eremiobacteraceae bacterium]